MAKRTSSKPTADLDQFYLSYTYSTPRLVGRVRNHHTRPDIRDGELIVTSRVLKIDFNKMQAETLNTVYKLGSPYLASEMGWFSVKTYDSQLAGRRK